MGDCNSDKLLGPSVPQWIERWLSDERFAPYLAACEGRVDKALELYKWNVALGQHLMGDIAYFEVALRNACDEAIASCWSGDKSWLLDDESPVRRTVLRKSAHGEVDVNRINRKIIDTTVGGLPAGFSNGDLVSSLTLGFWVHLSDRSREAVIWRTGLYRAWPKGTNRTELQRSLDAILRVRNRIAHNERLFDPKQPLASPKMAAIECRRLFGMLQPEAALNLFGGEADGLTPFLDAYAPPVSVKL